MSYQYTNSIQEKEAPGAFHPILLAILLVGIYTALPLPITQSFYIPFVILFALSLYLLIVHYGTLNHLDIKFLTLCCGLLILNMFLSAAPLHYLQEKIAAFLQIMAGLVLGVFTMKMVASTPRSTLMKILIAAITILYALIILERTGITREISDSWREFAYTGMFTNPYMNDQRDLQMVNFIRPKAFTAEPAFLAGFCFIVLNAITLLSNRLRTVILTTLLAFFGLLLVGSPIFLLAIISIALLGAFRYTAGLAFLIPCGLLALALLLIYPRTDVLDETYHGILNRFEEFVEGDLNRVEDSSVQSRLIIPFTRAVPESIALNPMFGIGIGGKEYLSPRLDPTYSSRRDEAGAHERTMGTNSFASLIATMGIAGSILLTTLLGMYFVQHFGYFPVSILIPLLLFTFTRGAYETQSFWAVVFFLTGCAYKGSHAVQTVQEEKNSISTILRKPESVST